MDLKQKDALSRKVKQKLEQKGITLKQLGDDIDRSSGAVSNAVNGVSEKGLLLVVEYLIQKHNVPREYFLEQVLEFTTEAEEAIFNNIMTLKDMVSALATSQSRLSEQIGEAIKDLESKIVESRGAKRIPPEQA